MGIPANKMALYRQGLQRKLSRPLTRGEEADIDHATAEARQLAQQLLDMYHVNRVWLFGSVARRRPLRASSDIDLAVEGMPIKTYYKIVGDIQTESGRLVDLVRLENLRPAMKHIILSKGILLTDDSIR